MLEGCLRHSDQWDWYVIWMKNNISPISAERTGEHTALYTAKKI